MFGTDPGISRHGSCVKWVRPRKQARRELKGSCYSRRTVPRGSSFHALYCCWFYSTTAAVLTPEPKISSTKGGRGLIYVCKMAQTVGALQARQSWSALCSLKGHGKPLNDCMRATPIDAGQSSHP